MSNDKDAAATSAKTSNKDKALARIAGIVSRYKIIKVPVLIQDVVKHVFGDMKDAPDEKANKAHSLIAGLLNQMVEEQSVDQYSFSKVVGNPEDQTLSTITESVIVESGFVLTGFVPASSVIEDTSVVMESPADNDIFEDTDDSEDVAEVVDLEGEKLNTLIRRHNCGFAIVNHIGRGEDRKREVHLRYDISAAMGKHLALAAEESNSVELYALLPVELEIKSVLGQPVEVEDTEDEEPITAAE